jgi:hypothetical protein
LFLDRIAIPLDDAALWRDRKGKKYLYVDKARKFKTVIAKKKQKAKFVARKLALIEGTDYRTETEIFAAYNAGEVTVLEQIVLDRKGKYTVPK